MIFENQEIHNKDLASINFENERFEECEFNGCDLSQHSLTGAKFLDCVFIDCNLSSLQLVNVSFQDVVFSQCKLLGLFFEQCNSLLLSIHFKGCNLSHSVFSGLDIRKFKFIDSNLEGCDFSNAIASRVSFGDCNLKTTIFQDTDLTSADFRDAYNYSFEPSENQITGAKFSLSELPGLLSRYNIEVA